jgi:hypothetical protein
VLGLTPLAYADDETPATPQEHANIATPAPTEPPAEQPKPDPALQATVITDDPFATPPNQAKGEVVDIVSDTLTYDDVKQVYVATGQVHVIISNQNSELIADKITYDPAKATLLADGHVQIIRNGEVTRGSYARIALNRESVLLDDATTKIEAIRVKAKQAFVNEAYVRMVDGKLVLSRDQLVAQATQTQRMRQGLESQEQLTRRGVDPQIFRTGWQPHDLNTRKVIAFADADNLNSSKTNDNAYIKVYEDAGIPLDTTQLPKANSDPFEITTQRVRVTQYPDDYQKLDFYWPKLTFKGHTLLTYPHLDIGLDQATGRFDYLGPKVGFDPDLGGLHAGPGWNTKLGPGSLKVSPMLTFGQEISRESDGSFQAEPATAGFGAHAIYTDTKTVLQGGAATQNNYFMGYAERRIFDGRTRLIASMNRTYNGGIITGSERPAYSLQINDARPLWTGNTFTLLSYAAAGFYKDEFNPTNNREFFVSRPSSSPEEAGRLVSQLMFRNHRPLISLGDSLDFGIMVQAMNAGYTTGDVYSVIRGGPTANFHYKDRFLSQAYLALTETMGDTPFVFDRYFAGNQALSLNNALRINKFLMIGARSDLDLGKKNARGDLLVGNTLYVSVGPPDVKFNVGVDLVRRLVSFGVTFYPSTGTNEIKFNEAEVFRPQPYFVLPTLFGMPDNG